MHELLLLGQRTHIPAKQYNSLQSTPVVQFASCCIKRNLYKRPPVPPPLLPTAPTGIRFSLEIGEPMETNTISLFWMILPYCLVGLANGPKLDPYSDHMWSIRSDLRFLAVLLSWITEYASISSSMPGTLTSGWIGGFCRPGHSLRATLGSWTLRSSSITMLWRITHASIIALRSLCLQSLQGPWSIFHFACSTPNALSTSFLLASKYLLLVAHRCTNALYQSSPLRIYSICQVVTHTVRVTVDSEVHRRSVPVS